MTVFALTVERPAGPVMIVVDAAGSIRYRGTKEKVAAVKTILRGSTATMHNLDDSKNTSPLRLVRKLFAAFGSGSYTVLKGQARLTAELKREKKQISSGKLI